MYVIEDLERPLQGRKPAELLKLISRLDSSDIYKSKVADKYSKLFEGLGVMEDSYCTTLKEDVKPFSSKESTLPLLSENNRRAGHDVGDRCHIQS